jgi:UDP-glucose 4-epimerase
MRIVITGGRGYIGTNLVKYLHEKDGDMIIDIYDKVDKLRAENIQDLGYYDFVVHLAAISGIAASKNDLSGAIRDNVSAAFHVFNKSLTADNIPRVIFASSQAAKTPEANFYAMTKYMAETEAQRLNRIYPINISILRFTNVYGGIDYLEKKDTVVSRFMNLAKKKECIVINGDGSQIRDFIHVNDICEIIYRVIKANGIRKIIDVGSGVETSIMSLAKMFDTEFTYDRLSDSIGTSKNVADISDLKELLDFTPTLKLTDYIKEELSKEA